MAIGGGPFDLLPEEVLLLIITQVSILEAFTICSSLTVRNHRNLWRWNNTFELDETQFTDVERRRGLLRVGNLTWANHIKGVGRRRFVQFVNGTLLNLVSSIVKFSIRFHYQPEYYFLIQSWLMFAIARNPEELNLDFSDGDPLLAVPFSNQYFFTLPEFPNNYGSSICRMRLRQCCLDLFSFQSFTSLSSLVLEQVMVTQGEIVQLITQCPVLDVLKLLDCRGLTQVIMTTPELRLKELIVKDCESLSLIKVFAPSLRTFSYRGTYVDFRFRNLQSIEYVELDFGLNTYARYASREVVNILRSFRRAKVIKLCSFLFKIFLEDHPQYWESLQQFVNLEHLTLKTCSGAYELAGICFILGLSPNLKTIEIFNFYREMTAYTDSLFPCIANGYKFEPTLPLDHLKTVTVTNYTGSKNELDVLKVLLRSAGTLEKLIITPRDEGVVIKMENLDDGDIASPHLELVQI